LLVAGGKILFILEMLTMQFECRVIDQDDFEGTLERLVFRFNESPLAKQLANIMFIKSDGQVEISDTDAFAEILSKPLEELHGGLIRAYVKHENGSLSLLPHCDDVLRILSMDPGSSSQVDPSVNVAEIIASSVRNEEIYTGDEGSLCDAGFNPARTIYLMKFLGKMATDSGKYDVCDSELPKRGHRALYELADALSPSSRSGKFDDNVQFKRIVAFFSLRSAWEGINIHHVEGNNQGRIVLPTLLSLRRTARDYILEAGVRTEEKYGRDAMGMVLSSIASSIGGRLNPDTAGPLCIVMADNDVDFGVNLVRALPVPGETYNPQDDPDAQSYLAGLLGIYDTHDVVLPHVWFDELRSFYDRQICDEASPGVLVPRFTQGNFHRVSFDVFEQAGIPALGPLLHAINSLMLPHIDSDPKNVPPIVNQMRTHLMGIFSRLQDNNPLLKNGSPRQGDDFDASLIGYGLLLPEHLKVRQLSSKQVDMLLPVVLSAHMRQQEMVGAHSSLEESDPFSSALLPLVGGSRIVRPRHPVAALAFDLLRRTTMETLDGDNSPDVRLERLEERLHDVGSKMPDGMKRALGIADMADSLERGRRFINSARVNLLLTNGGNGSSGGALPPAKKSNVLRRGRI
jgi:hypothetical protein